MKRPTTSSPFGYQHPATYVEIVEAARRDHDRRIAELKAASRLITAIEPDLAALAEQRIYYSIDRYSMYLVDCSTRSPTGTKRKWALRIRYGMSEEMRDRMVSAFLVRGWAVDDARTDGRLSTVVLRRPKTQIRVCLECSPELALQLRPEPAKEAQ